MIIFDRSFSYISPSVIDDIIYYIRDPLLAITFSPFLSNGAYLTPLYELQRQGSTSSVDPTLFTFDPLTLKLTVSSSLLSAIGTYQLQVKSYFGSLATTSYFVTSPFLVTILHFCLRSTITAP